MKWEEYTTLCHLNNVTLGDAASRAGLNAPMVLNWRKNKAQPPIQSLLKLFRYFASICKTETTIMYFEKVFEVKPNDESLFIEKHTPKKIPKTNALHNAPQIVSPSMVEEEIRKAIVLTLEKYFHAALTKTATNYKERYSELTNDFCTGYDNAMSDALETLALFTAMIQTDPASQQQECE